MKSREANERVQFVQCPFCPEGKRHPNKIVCQGCDDDFADKMADLAGAGKRIFPTARKWFLAVAEQKREAIQTDIKKLDVKLGLLKEQTRADARRQAQELAGGEEADDSIVARIKDRLWKTRGGDGTHRHRAILREMVKTIRELLDSMDPETDESPPRSNSSLLSPRPQL